MITIFKRRPKPHLPVLVDLPAGGKVYVWPKPHVFGGEVRRPEGAIFYTQGDRHYERAVKG